MNPTPACVEVISSAQGGHTDSISALLHFPNDGEHYILSAGYDSKVVVWKLNAAAAAAAPGQAFLEGVFADEGYHCGVTALCGMPDKDCGAPLLVVGLRDGTMVIKTLPDFASLLCMTPHHSYGHSGAVNAIKMGPGCTFFTASQDKKMMAWQIDQSLYALLPAQGGAGF
jgi:WD40 repeat protein